MIHKLPQEIINGINLINKGEYYQAHEVLERTWMLETKDIRQLYQGLIQLSVALFHMERGNITGTLKLIPKIKFNISPFENRGVSIDLQKLLLDLDLLELELLKGIETPNYFKIHRPIVIAQKTG
jgi:hypothetical protein